MGTKYAAKSRLGYELPDGLKGSDLGQAFRIFWEFLLPFIRTPITLFSILRANRTRVIPPPSDCPKGLLPIVATVIVGGMTLDRKLRV